MQNEQWPPGKPEQSSGDQDCEYLDECDTDKCEVNEVGLIFFPKLSWKLIKELSSKAIHAFHALKGFVGLNIWDEGNQNDLFRKYSFTSLKNIWKQSQF